MDILSITLHLCMIYICVERISGVYEDLKVRQGQNITLYCEFKVENTWELEWRRNCSHVNQPPLVLEGRWHPPRFTLQSNTSSKSVDLRIENITEHDLGLYYCRHANQEGKTVKLLLEETLPGPQPTSPPSPGCGQCWMLLVVLCPVCSLIFALISSICTYWFFHTKEPKKMEFYPSTTNSEDRRRKQDGDLCYASLDLPPGGHKPRPKKKTRQNNDFSTYSDIRTGIELR